MQVYHDLTSLQKGLLRSHHSANILNDQMYLFGGYCKKNMVSTEDLTVIDLSKTISFSNINFLY